VRQLKTIRLLALAGGFLCASAAFAQHGGGHGGGGMGGPPMGGGMGSPRMGGGIGVNRSERNMNTPRLSGPQLGLSGRWWDERKTIKTLNLRDDQKQRMDEIFAGNKGTLMNLLGNLQHEQESLSSMSKQDRQDETKVFAAINRVEVARGELAKEIAHVQLQIRQQLDPEQVTKLDEAIASQQ
jgi:Spy/CpxP family protein refolding chaperone